MKETFIVRTEWFAAISELEKDDQLVFYQNLFHYHMGNENLINLKNLTVRLVWKLIQPGMERNINSYDKRKDTSRENGAKGGRPPKIQEDTEKEEYLNNLKKPNETLPVLVPVPEPVLVSKTNTPQPVVAPLDFMGLEIQVNTWLAYKKNKGKKYKDNDSIQIMIKKLHRFSKGNPQVAQEIIEDAMGNNYEGFFEPKPKNETDQQQTAGGTIKSGNITFKPV